MAVKCLYRYVWIFIFITGSASVNFSTLPAELNEIAAIRMSLRVADRIDSMPLHSIYLGERFYMFLEYTGQSNYSIYPINCTAYDGTLIKDNEETIIYKYKPFFVEDRVISNFTKVSNKLIYTEMFAFRLGSDYVTLSCEVGVCSGKTDFEKGCIPTPTKRRRGKGFPKPVRKIHTFKIENKGGESNGSVRLQHLGHIIYMIAFVLLGINMHVMS